MVGYTPNLSQVAILNFGPFLTLKPDRNQFLQSDLPTKDPSLNDGFSACGSTPRREMKAQSTCETIGIAHNRCIRTQTSYKRDFLNLRFIHQPDLGSKVLKTRRIDISTILSSYNRYRGVIACIFTKTNLICPILILETAPKSQIHEI